MANTSSGNDGIINSAITAINYNSAYDTTSSSLGVGSTPVRKLKDEFDIFADVNVTPGIAVTGSARYNTVTIDDLNTSRFTRTNPDTLSWQDQIKIYFGLVYSKSDGGHGGIANYYYGNNAIYGNQESKFNSIKGYLGSRFLLPYEAGTLFNFPVAILLNAGWQGWQGIKGMINDRDENNWDDFIEQTQGAWDAASGSWDGFPAEMIGHLWAIRFDDGIGFVGIDSDRQIYVWLSSGYEYAEGANPIARTVAKETHAVNSQALTGKLTFSFSGAPSYTASAAVELTSDYGGYYAGVATATPTNNGGWSGQGLVITATGDNGTGPWDVSLNASYLVGGIGDAPDFYVYPNFSINGVQDLNTDLAGPIFTLDGF